MGIAYTHTSQSVRMVNSEDDFSNTTSMPVIKYEQRFGKSRIEALVSYNRFQGFTNIKFPSGGVKDVYNMETNLVGFTGVNVNRFDIGIAYNLFARHKFFYLTPYAAIGLQFSNPTGAEIYSETFRINGPDYQELEYITADSRKTFQAVPSFGFKIGACLGRKIEIGLNFQGVYGFKSYQDMYFKYAYKGVPQEVAVFQSKGTGLFVAFTVGYRFGKAIPDISKG